MPHPAQPGSAGLRNHKAKCFVLGLYLVVTLAIPFVGHIPFVRDYLNQNAQSYIPKDIDPFFKQYIKALKTGDNQHLYSLTSPGVRQQLATSTLHEITAALASTTDQVEGIALHMNTVVGKGTYYDTMYEVGNDDPKYKYMQVEFTAENTGDGMGVDSVRLTQEIKSIKDLGPYDFVRQTALWIAAYLLPVFIAYTGFRYIRRAQKQNWIIFLIILLFSFYVVLVYRDGTMGVGVNVGIFSATYKNSFGYYYMIPIPVGAIYYWLRKRHYEASQ